MKIKTEICIILTLFSLIMIGCSQPPVAAIEPDNWNVGYLIPTTLVEQKFTVRNLGGSDLVIDSIIVPSNNFEIKKQPGNILPQDQDFVEISFKTPEDTGTVSETLKIYTNDPQNSPITIDISGRILPVNVNGENKNLAVLPIQSNSRETEITNLTRGISKSLILAVNELDTYRLVTANQLVKNLTADPAYKDGDTQALLTKWGKIMGIRYILFGQIELSGEINQAAISLVDVYFKYPVVRKITGFKREEADAKIVAEAEDLLKNLIADQKRITQQMLQKEWMEKRQSLLKRQAPNFILTDIKTDDKIELEKHFGKTIVMHFFSLECEACEKEIKWMEEIKALGDDVAVFGICIDVGKKEEVLEFISDKKISYPILLPKDVDEDNQLEPYYGGGTPITVVIDHNGIVQESLVGFSTKGLQNIEKLVKKIRE